MPFLQLPSETISSLEAAARDRTDDLLALLSSGRTYWGVYTSGYIVECLLKSAWARTAGAPMIGEWNFYRRIAEGWGLAIGVIERRNEHDLVSWARLIVRERDFVGRPLRFAFATELMVNVLKIALHWHESMRYQPNQDVGSQVETVMSGVNWVRGNHGKLER